MTPIVQVPPSIVPGALITWCGEAPGGQEVLKGEGFVGGSGNVARRTAAAANIDFNKGHRTNVAKRRPAGDKFGIFYHDPRQRKHPTEELLWWQQLLLAEVNRYRPNVFVALGNEALKAITSRQGILSWSGSILISDKIPGLKVIPVPHPSFIMRDNWEYYYISIRYFKKIAEEMKSRDRVLQEPEGMFTIGPDISEALEWIVHIRDNPTLEWYLDIETRGDTLNCFGLWVEDRPNCAICIPVQTTQGPYFTINHEVLLWRALSSAMAANPNLGNQNIVYDLEYILDYRCEPSGIKFDPMLGMNVAYAEFPKGLDFTTSIYTNHDYYKDEGKTWKKKTPDRQVWVYNCKDMVITPRVSTSVKKDLQDLKLTELYAKRTNAMLPIAVEMQRNRLRLDKSWHSKLAGLLLEEKSKVHQELTEITGQDINVKSGPQIQKLVYEDLRLPIHKKRGTDAVTTDENTLKEIRANLVVGSPPWTILNLILKERHLRTKESNYINVKFDQDPDGQLYLGYMANIAGTKTGRWAFSKSPKWRGSSPQTISKVIRLMYVAPAGSVFWQRDLSQAEVRVVAELAQCYFLLEVFASGKSIHKLIGGRIFSKDPEAIIKDELEYDTSKSVVHAYDYMMRYKRLAVEANLQLAFAKWVLDTYGALVPEIPIWHGKVKDTVIRTGELRTPMGRIRKCYAACSAIVHTGQLPDDIWRDLVSYVPQSTVPDILNEGMLATWNELPWAKWHQQGHDSFLASGPPERTEEVYEVSERNARVPFYINGKECIIPSEFSWGYSWGAMLKYVLGEDTSYDAWLQRATGEKYFDEGKIKEKLYSLL